MVKCHRRTGTPRHFGKNQKKHPPTRFRVACETCSHCGRASGDRYSDGHSMGYTCFNKKSRFYMRRIDWHWASCSCYEVKRGKM